MTELVPAKHEDIMSLIEKEGSSKYTTEQALQEASKAGDWLPYIQLCGGESGPCKDGHVGMGNFGLCKGRNIWTDLGNEIIVFMASSRVKAFDFATKTAYFNPISQDYIHIKDTCNIKNSQKGFGTEYLIWLSEHKELATYYFNNKTARNVAQTVNECIKKNIRTLKIKSTPIEAVVEGVKRKWVGPLVLPHDFEIEMPPQEAFQQALTKFNNPPEVEVFSGGEPQHEDAEGEEEVR